MTRRVILLVNRESGLPTCSSILLLSCYRYHFSLRVIALVFLTRLTIFTPYPPISLDCIVADRGGSPLGLSLWLPHRSLRPGGLAAIAVLSVPHPKHTVPTHMSIMSLHLLKYI